MVEHWPVRTEVFLDSSYSIALSSSSDSFHERAVRLANELEAAKTRLVTTRAVLLELGNALAKQRYRQAAVKLLNALEADHNVKIVPLSEDLYARAVKLYRERPDKEWGLTDCVSFVVMQERGITEALTTDEHFTGYCVDCRTKIVFLPVKNAFPSSVIYARSSKQAGFRALLREDSS